MTSRDADPHVRPPDQRETPVSATIATISDMFRASVTSHPERPFFLTKNGGEWSAMTYVEVDQQVGIVRKALLALGVRHGDRVAVISGNRPEWAVCAYACYAIGAIWVPMYEAQSESDWAHIINDCKPKVLFVGTEAVRMKIHDKRIGYGTVGTVISFAPVPDHVKTWSRLKRQAGPKVYEYRALWALSGRFEERRLPDMPMIPEPRDTACLIYTSGTTGNPKGVMLTHGNITSNVEAVHALGIIGPNDRSLSFLPWAHVFGHTAELHLMMRSGATVAVCEGVDRLLGNLSETTPTVLFTVPNVFSKVHAAVRMQVAAKPRLVQWLFATGLTAAKRKSETGSAGFWGAIVLAIVTRLIFSKAKARFGGRLRMAICGGAALPKDVGMFIDALGIPVLEGYGMTETSPIATVNVPGGCKLGTGGRPIKGVEVIIRQEGVECEDPRVGEITVRGPNVMAGYYNLPAETAAALVDGCMRTGDLGYLDDDGFLHVTGRIKEQYKLENGKYVAPGPLEDAIKRSPLVANALIYGDNRPHNVALVVPNIPALRTHMRTEPGVTDDALLNSAAARKAVRESVQQALTDCKGYERVKDVALISEDFTQENGLLTPTMKVKRRKVVDRHQELLNALYA